MATILTRSRFAVDQAIWPTTAYASDDGDLSIGGVRLTEVTERFGSPVHVVDEADVRRRCRTFRKAFAGGEVVYAGKAFLCRAMTRWIAAEGLSLDVCSAGELAVARAAGFPAARMLMHGNAKTPEDLKAALDYGVGRLVVDCLGEVARLSALTAGGRRRQVLIRVTPGVDAHTHRAVTTGTDDQQFGFSIASGAAADAVRRVLDQPGLELVGLHCHLGSQITDLAAFELAAARLIDLLVAVRDEHGISLPQLDLGGGFAVPYREDERELSPVRLADHLTAITGAACSAHRLPVPRIIVEPGRAISARAGVTVYRVISVKRSAAGRVFVAVNGGMSDNPRPGLYGSRYSVRLIGRTATSALRAVTVVGRHCEAGDVLIPDAELPADLRPGDLLAVPCTGAYHHSMGSNYNLVRRPPVVAVREGRAWPLIRRESEEDLLRRDVG
jgi:diaminopimelate decarboxylase